MTDWLSEVLHDLHFNEHEYKKSEPIPNTVKGLQDGCEMEIAKAHKLISAQLIRERINELERLPKAVEENHMLRYAKTGDGWEELRSWHVDAYLKDRQKDLTNKLKEVEDG